VRRHSCCKSLPQIVVKRNRKAIEHVVSWHTTVKSRYLKGSYRAVVNHCKTQFCRWYSSVSSRAWRPFPRRSFCKEHFQFQ
jgi:hypothetical protein